MAKQHENRLAATTTTTTQGVLLGYTQIFANYTSSTQNGIDAIVFKITRGAAAAAKPKPRSRSQQATKHSRNKKIAHLFR